MGRKLFLVAVALVLVGVTAAAELQNVSIGAEIRMRYRYYNNVFNENVSPNIRIPDAFLTKRPIGPQGAASIFDWDDKDPDWHFSESSFKFWFDADLTEGVSARIAFYDFFQWGEDFRSNYITGQDFRSNSRVGQNVEIFEGYVQTEDTFGMPLRLRIGRQTMKLGKGWLVGEMTTPTQRLSYDGIRATWAQDPFTVDAFAMILNETGNAEQDGDVTFYGAYGTWNATEYLDLSAYWYWLRDARSLNDTNFVWLVEWLENVFDVDDYDVTNLHTLGFRANGQYGGWDYDLEFAYQLGNADSTGIGFRPAGMLYGDDDASYDTFALELTLGYTFEQTKWSPRVFVQGIYFDGEDNRDLSFWDWLNPFYRPEASISFNRLFTEMNYLPTTCDNGCMTNFYQVTAGIELKPTDKISVRASLAKAWIKEPFDFPVSWEIGDYRIPIAPAYSFWTEEGPDDIGWETALMVTYRYTEDLTFIGFWGHLFTGDGISQGAFSQFNGNSFTGGSDDDDADYFVLMTIIRF